MSDYIEKLLVASQSVNTKTISLVRCLLLTLLMYFTDGLQYRELKAALKISDGKLVSNLSWLEAVGYIAKSTVKLERRKMSVYSLTSEGRKEARKIAKWMNLVREVSRIGDRECQTILTE